MRDTQVPRSFPLEDDKVFIVDIGVATLSLRVAGRSRMRTWIS